MTADALAGLKVLDLAWVVAGPAIGRSLADYGATVVRVESSTRIETARFMGPFPDGLADPNRSALFGTYNAGKLGISIDLRSEAGQAILEDLVRWADVLVESFAPGQLARWGMAPDRLRAINPRLIGLSSSLMGQTGPYSNFGGYGNMGAAVAGFQQIVGNADALPIGPYGPYTDYVGPRFALVALLAALDQRRRSGEGCWIDIAQAESGIQFLGPQIAHGAATGEYPGANGNRDASFAPHGVFRCEGEDEWIAIVARDDAEWATLAALIGGDAMDARFATLAGRKQDEDRLEAVVAGWTASRSPAAIEAQLQGLGIPAHRASSSADMLADPQLQARGHFVHLPHPLGGESVFDASRYALSETPARYSRTAPHFNRDRDFVLQDLLGYDAARVAELDAAGVLR
ncbi:MAG: CoA transferase [Sphingomonadales bacterium]|nr:MAG: CoA transferase [Sphingomonadales bacterium]